MKGAKLPKMPKDIRKGIQDRTDALAERLYDRMRTRVYARINAEESLLDKAFEEKAKMLREELRGLEQHTDAEVERALIRVEKRFGDKHIAAVRKMIEAGSEEGAIAGKVLFETMFGKEGPEEERPFVEQYSSELRPKLRPLRLLVSAGKRRSTS